MPLPALTYPSHVPLSSPAVRTVHTFMRVFGHVVTHLHDAASIIDTLRDRTPFSSRCLDSVFLSAVTPCARSPSSPIVNVIKNALSIFFFQE